VSFEPEGPYQCYDGGATFIRRCVKCNLFVKPDESIQVNEETGLKKAPNADCKKCGRTEMLFVGFI
jgi:hypothetical protein